MTANPENQIRVIRGPNLFNADERRFAALSQISADGMMKNLNANEEGMERE